MARKIGSRSEITGPKVRQTAVKLFSRHGFAAVSMRQIASEVGVQAGALYSYTPDKQGLLFDIMHSHMSEMIAAWQSVPKRGTPSERLDQFVRFHIGFNYPRRDAVFISYMELRALTPDNYAIIQAQRKDYERELISIIEDGKSRGVFLVDEPKVIAFALIGTLTQVNTWFRDDGPLSIGEVENMYSKIVLGAVHTSEVALEQVSVLPVV